MALATGPDPVPQLRLAEADITRYREEGYLLLPGLIAVQDAAALHDEVIDIMGAIGLPMTKLRQTTEYLAGSRLDAFINSPQLRAIAEQLLAGPSTVYMPFTAVKSARGGGTFHFHQDNQYTRFDGPALNLWTALSPMTPDNGCLQVVPRSHLQGTLEAVPSGDGDTHKKITWEPADFVPLVMRPGDCVAFSRLTIHGSGANTAAEPRVAYAVQFHRNDVRALQGEEWQLLADFPRWNVRPVQAFSVPAERQDGH